MMFEIGGDQIEMIKIGIYLMFAFCFILVGIAWMRTNRVIEKRDDAEGSGVKRFLLNFDQSSMTEIQMKVEEDFKQAGNPLGLNYMKYILIRDALFVGVIAYICVTKFIMGNGDVSPFAILAPVLLYLFVFTFHKYSAFHFIMSNLIDLKQSKKNFDVFNLFQMFLNEYEQRREHDFQVEYLMKEYKRYLPHIEGAINEYLNNVSKIPASYAYDVFSREVGTELGKQLATILYEVSQTSADNAREILLQRYDEFRLKRKEEVKKRVKFINGIAWGIAYGGAFFVLASLMFANAYLQYSETQDLIFTVGQ